MSAPLVPFDLTNTSVSPEDLAAARTRLRDVAAERKGRGCSTAALALVIWFVIMVAGGTILNAWGWSALIGGIVSIAASQRAWSKSDRADQAAAEILARAAEVKDIGLLLEVTRFRKSDVAILGALNRLLPQLTPDQARNLTQAECQRMISLLFEAPVQTMLALLNALEKVGNAHALPYVSSLAQGKAIPSHAMPYASAIVNAAGQCAAAINTRIAAVKISDTLLRASGAPGESPAVLLRSSDQAHTIPADQLMRPHDGQESIEAADDAG